MMLLEQKPFAFAGHEKNPLFLDALAESAQWHYRNNPESKLLYDRASFNPYEPFAVTDLPFIPASLFKKFKLRSVPEDQIVKTLYSSSTSGAPSVIVIDAITALRQVRAVNAILADYIGKVRRPFIVLDAENVVRGVGQNLSSRGTAIRGMLSLASSIQCVLNDVLALDIKALSRAFRSGASSDGMCFFGFTWLLFSLYEQHHKDREVLRLLREVHNGNAYVLHIGGWKKLKERAIEKKDFNAMMSDFFGVASERVIDCYGMTEQLGTIYPDCPSGYKHVPLYSELVVRDPSTLEPLPYESVGILELVSPLPHSYPGIAILAEDLGRVVGVDDCRCGRKGAYFLFEKRSEGVEMKGCGDALITTSL